MSFEYSGFLLSKNIRCGGVMVVYHGELTPVCGNTVKMCIFSTVIFSEKRLASVIFE